MAAAFERRATLHDDPTTDAYRLVHGWTEGLSGLEVDQFGHVAVIRCLSSWAAALPTVLEALDRHRRFDTVVAKVRRDPVRALRGEVPSQPFPVSEAGLRFAIEAWQPRNPGLFIDARPARGWIRANSDGRLVLNLFAFTGSLGVAARAGGARAVTHVDAQRRALQRCRDNHRLNQQPVDDRDLVRVNVYQHLRRQSTGRRRFDAVILDAPPDAGGAYGKRSPIGLGPVALAPYCARILNPDGWLLVFFHHGRGRAELEQEFCAAAAAAADLDVVWQSGPGLDVPEVDEARTLRLTAFRRR